MIYRTAVHECLATGVEFSPQIRKGSRLLVREYDHWYQCPMCYQPFVSSGFPDVFCTECWCEGSYDKPIMDLGLRKRLKPGRRSRPAFDRRTMWAPMKKGKLS